MNKIPEKIKRFIENHIDLIDDNRFGDLYKKALWPSLGKVTYVLLKAGINPLDHLDYIPENFFTEIYPSPQAFFVIPEHIKRIERLAFYRCDYVKNINIPSQVTIIHDRTFYCCQNLNSVKIGEGVRIIEQSAFSNNKKLTTVIFAPGSQLKRIGEGVFAICPNLTNIQWGGTKEQWNAISKENNWNYETGDYTIHCSDGDIKKYE